MLERTTSGAGRVWWPGGRIGAVIIVVPKGTRVALCGAPKGSGARSAVSAGKAPWRRGSSRQGGYWSSDRKSSLTNELLSRSSSASPEAADERLSNMPGTPCYSRPGPIIMASYAMHTAMGWRRKHGDAGPVRYRPIPLAMRFALLATLTRADRLPIDVPIQPLSETKCVRLSKLWHHPKKSGFREDPGSQASGNG